jgi:4-hydroxy-4-methyl-2-oxoglutarate aldolase
MKRTPPAQILDALRAFDSPTIANAIEACKARNPTDGYASMELRCQFPEFKPMVGYAVTCTCDSTSPAPIRRIGSPDLLNAIREAPKPAVVVIQNLGTDRLRSCLVGDMSCAAWQKLGAVGVATDGGYRDRGGIIQQAPGFQVFAPGLVASRGTARVIEVGVTVSICGLTVRPGDLLHGDESGLVQVPVEGTSCILQQAERIRASEQEFFAFLHSDSYSYEEMKQRRKGRAPASSNSEA